jgi:hypothetical protein
VPKRRQLSRTRCLLIPSDSLVSSDLLARAAALATMGIVLVLAGCADSYRREQRKDPADAIAASIIPR